MSQSRKEQYISRNTKEYEKYCDDENIRTWEVRGEDPNCDFGGSHHNPLIGIFSGRYIDVLENVVEHPQFWQWGAGGSIREIKVVMINASSNARRAKLVAEKLALEARLKQIYWEL